MSVLTVAQIVASALSTGFKRGTSDTAYAIAEGLNVSVQCAELEDGSIEVRNMRLRVADIEDPNVEQHFDLLDSLFESEQVKLDKSGNYVWVSDEVLDSLDFEQLAKAWYDARTGATSRRVVRPTWATGVNRPSAAAPSARRAGVNRPIRPSDL